MTNLTISVDADVLRRARIRALENNESVNAYLARKLEEYAKPDQGNPFDDFLAITEDYMGTTNPNGSTRTWTRESIQRYPNWPQREEA